MEHLFQTNRLKLLAIPAGLEPATLCLEGRCSIQLSYGTSPPSKTGQRVNTLPLPSLYTDSLPGM